MSTPEELRPDRLARALEDRGFDSLWYGEHSHIPVSRLTPYPRGGTMPDLYKRMMDPFISLMAAGSASTTLLVGTKICLALERDLFELAKTVSTLDLLTGGRVRFGVGVGWNREELADHSSVPFAQRYLALGERVDALRTLWTEEEPEFHGRWIDFPPAWSFPKPVQRPHPPVLAGMSGPLGMREAVAWSDGWMPIDAALGDVAGKVAIFRTILEANDRDPATFPISMVAFGDPTEATLDQYRDLGLDRVILGPGRARWDEPDQTFPFLDRYAGLLPALT